MITKRTVKLISAGLAVLLLLAVLRMPYGYYELVRIIAAVSFTILAVYEHKKNNDLFLIVFIGLALLFQPVIKISLGRILWNIVDVTVAVFLIILFFRRYK